jgi:hypothetical protein
MEARSDSVDDANIRGGITKMAVHQLIARKEMSPKANRLPKAITIAREFIH